MVPSFIHYTTDIYIKSNPGGNWRVKRHIVQRTATITWICDIADCYIWVMFPEGHTPLANAATQVHGYSPLSVTLSVPLGDQYKGPYPYCVLILAPDGEVHLVEGNSPPEMIID